MLTWPDPKDPDEVLDYQFDWGGQRLELDETLVSSTVTVVSGGIEVDRVSDNGKIVTFWVTGGSPGEACEVLCRVTTSKERTYDQTGRLRVRSR